MQLNLNLEVEETLQEVYKGFTIIYTKLRPVEVEIKYKPLATKKKKRNSVGRIEIVENHKEQYWKYKATVSYWESQVFLEGHIANGKQVCAKCSDCYNFEDAKAVTEHWLESFYIGR